MNTEDIRIRLEAGQTYNFENNFNSEVQGRDYFLVTQMDELEKQPELKTILFNNYKITFQDLRSIIFDLKKEK
jgi:hypothetical protein